MKLNTRKIVAFNEETFSEAGEPVEKPLVRAAVAAVIQDPLVGKYVKDLSELIDSGASLVDTLIPRLVEVIGLDIQQIDSFGKAVLVGEDCDLEHGHALLHPKLGISLREKMGGVTIVPSTAIRGTLGCQIVVPLHYKRAAYVRSHFDSFAVSVSDAPRGDELILVIAASSGGRPNARIGGLSKQDAKGVDGLR